jgi:soluble lytic murein transglycosylase
MVKSSRMRRRWLWILISVVLLDGLLYYFWSRNRTEHRYDGLIRQAARRYGVEPALVKAVVWRESAFNPKARGLAGEIGLMQIRSLAAEEWAQAEHVRPFAHSHVSDPGTNTLVGAWYLNKLIKRYRDTDNAVAYALADYNAGRVHVLRWMEGTAKTNSRQFLAQMDFPGTQKYIRSVMSRADRYRSGFAARLSTPRSIASQQPHLLLEFGSQGRSFGIRSFARDMNGLPENDITAAEGDWNLKAVPTFQANLPTEMIGHRHDRETGELRQCHDSLLHDVTWSARSIRCDRQIVSALGPTRQLQQCLRAATAARPADRLHSEMLQNLREQSAILAGADEGGQTSRR